MTAIKRWFRTLIGILYGIIICFPAILIWMLLKIITLGELNWISPLSVDSKLYDIFERILGEDHWLLS